MIGQRLVQVRKVYKLSQIQLADELQTAASNINRYESNKVEPGLHFLHNFSKKYNVNLHWLISGEGEMFIIDTDKQINNITYKDSDKNINLNNKIALLEIENKKLDQKNRELSDELIKQFKQLVSVQSKLIEHKI